MRPARVLICVAEDSADLYAAAVARAARRRLPQVRFFGLTGPRMRREGVETLDDLASQAAMLGDAVRLAGRAWRICRRIEGMLRDDPPDVVVLLDSPELNLRIARIARRHGVPVLYYIAPQTWASRSGRVRPMRETIDRLACILPFEPPLFREAGIAAEYVGHPLLELLRDARPDPQTVATLRETGRVVALLPGSREGVIRRVLPKQLEVVGRLRQRAAGIVPVVSAVDARREALIRGLLVAHGAFQTRTLCDNASLLEAAELALVASGTATLEVALHRVPMIVMYEAGPAAGLAYRLIGRRVIHTPHLSLVNILADRRLVPEFMPQVVDPAAVARVAEQLLDDATWRGIMQAGLDEVIGSLGDRRPSERVCELIAELGQWPDLGRVQAERGGPA